MSEAVLDDAAVDALLRDIGTLTEVDEIIVKQRPGRVDDSQQVTLDQVKLLLHDKAVRGVQVRYRHDGAHWWDTLMPVDGGVRLVRVKHDFS